MTIFPPFGQLLGSPDFSTSTNTNNMKLKKLASIIGCDKMDDSEIIKEVRDCVPGIQDDAHAHEWAIINIDKFTPKEGRTAVEIVGYEIPLCYAR